MRCLLRHGCVIMRIRIGFAVAVVFAIVASTATYSNADDGVGIEFLAPINQSPVATTAVESAIETFVAAANAHLKGYTIWVNGVSTTCPKNATCSGATARFVVQPLAQAIKGSTSDATLTMQITDMSGPSLYNQLSFPSVVKLSDQTTVANIDKLHEMGSLGASTASPLAIDVMFFPPTISGPASLTQQTDDAINAITTAIDANRHVYRAWSIDSNDNVSSCPTGSVAPCKASSARIVVSTTVTADGSFKMVAVDRTVGTTVGQLSGNVTKALAPTDGDINGLIGTATVVGGNELDVNHGYEQYIELVPEFQSGNTPDYGGLLEQNLRERGISVFRSAYTTVSLSAASDATVCNAGQRYLVYSVAITTDTKKLIGQTRIAASASGILLDCAGNQPLAVSGQRSDNVTTSAGTLAAYGGVLLTLFSKLGTGFALFTPAFGALVDSDPTSATLQSNIADQALQRLVDDICLRLPVPVPQVLAGASGNAGGPPPPTPTPAQQRIQSQGAGGGGGAPAAAPAAASVPANAFNPQPVTGSTPYVPQCTRYKLSQYRLDSPQTVDQQLIHKFTKAGLPKPAP
jgi:hypothetical protein